MNFLIAFFYVSESIWKDGEISIVQFLEREVDDMKMEEDRKEEKEREKMQFKASNGRGGAEEEEEEMREIRSVQNFLPPARLLLLRILFLPHSFIPNLKFLREKK